MQCEGSLKTEYTKFEATHDKFCKDKAAHVQNFKGMPNERLLPHFLMSMAYILQVLMKHMYVEHGLLYSRLYRSTMAVSCLFYHICL
jgi:hypothetical protein